MVDTKLILLDVPKYFLSRVGPESPVIDVGIITKGYLESRGGSKDLGITFESNAGIVGVHNGCIWVELSSDDEPRVLC